MDQPKTEKTRATKTGTSRRGKSLFLVAVVFVAAFLYWHQRREPHLPGWGSNFEEALAEAKAAQKPKVLIFFTTSPMGTLDRIMVKRVLRSSTRRVLEKLGYPKVHLTTSSRRDLVERYGVRSTPAYVLVDPAGKLLKKQTGVLTDINFCTDFLETSINPPKPTTEP